MMSTVKLLALPGEADEERDEIKRTGVVRPRTKGRQLSVGSALHGFVYRRVVHVERTASAARLGRVPFAPRRALARSELGRIVRQAHRGPALAVVRQASDGVPSRGGDGETSLNSVVRLARQADRERTRSDEVGPAALVYHSRVVSAMLPGHGPSLAQCMRERRTRPVRVVEKLGARRYGRRSSRGGRRRGRGRNYAADIASRDRNTRGRVGGPGGAAGGRGRQD